MMGKIKKIRFPSSGCGKMRPSRVQSVVSSQGSLDSDMQGTFCVQDGRFGRVTSGQSLEILPRSVHALGE